MHGTTQSILFIAKCEPLAFPNIIVLLRIALTLPNIIVLLRIALTAKLLVRAREVSAS